MEAVQRSIWDQLPEGTRAALNACGTTLSVAKGTSLFGELDEVGELYFLLEGYVCLHRSSFRGEDRVIFVCAAGEILNEMVMENSKTSIAARALSDALLLRVPVAELYCLTQKDPILAQALFRALARKTRRLYHKVGNDTGTYTLKNRLAANVWKLARDYGIPEAEGRRVDFEVTVNLLSEMMGAKRESVSRALSELKRSGLVTHENGVLSVRDMSRLRAAISE